MYNVLKVNNDNFMHCTIRFNETGNDTRSTLSLSHPCLAISPADLEDENGKVSISVCIEIHITEAHPPPQASRAFHLHSGYFIVPQHKLYRRRARLRERGRNPEILGI